MDATGLGGIDVGSEAGALELTGLHRRYGDVVALDSLSFTVPPGQVFGFLGPNGARKTTAMRAIVGVASLDRILRTGTRLKVRQVLKSGS